MATVVDALVVTLGLDNSKFVKETKETEKHIINLNVAVNRAAKEIEASGGKAANFFSQIKAEALGLIGVLLGGRGITAFAKDATRSLSDMGRAAVNIGESVPALAAFRNMIERNGGSAEAATASLQGYANAIERFKVFGDATILQFLNPIGANVEDSPLAVYQKFMRFVEQNKDRPGGAQLVNIEGRGLGYDQGVINASLQIGTAAKARAELARSRELGVPTQEQIDRVTALQRAFTGLGQAAEQAGNNLLSDMAPALTKLADWASNEIAHNPGVAESVLSVATGLTALGAVRISANLMGLTGLAGALTGILSTANLLLSLVFAEEAIYYGTRIGSLNDGEQAELDRQRKALGLPTGPQGLPITGPPVANQSFTPYQAAFLQHLSDPESGGNYGAIGGSKNILTDLSHFPPNAHGHYGRYQFDQETWAEEAKKLNLGDFSPASQDWAAWDLAATEYWKQSGGRNLTTDLAAGGHDAEIARALQGRWPSVPGGSQSRLPRSSANYGLPAPGAFMRVPAGAAAAPSVGPQSLSIGTINVQTQATDAKGVAAGLHSAITDRWVAMANRGLN